MGLFNVLPENLFSVLSSPNRHFYVEALFMLRKAFKSEYAIGRELLLSMIVDRLSEMEVSWQNDDQERAADPVPDAPAGAGELARLLMRRLEETGWLEIEYKPDSFEEQITLPPYAISLLDLLYSFTEESRQEYGRHAFLTYMLLKSAGQEQDADEAWMALEQAAKEAENLQDALKNLLNNIRRYHRQLNEYISTSEILKGHFDQFQVLVNERVYHPLKTRDAVQRYKIPILGFCDSYLTDQAFLARLAEAASQNAADSDRQPEKSQAMDGVLTKIHRIVNIFDQVEELLADIDSKNRAYTRASADKLIYLLSEDQNIRGYLIKIISQARQLPPDRQQLILESPQLTCQSYLAHESLYLRATAHVFKDAVPLAVAGETSETAADGRRQQNAMQDFLRGSASRYSHERVIRYIMDLLGDKSAITSADLPLANDEDYIMAVLGALKGFERQTPYRVSFAESADSIRHGAYAIPAMTITPRQRGSEGRMPENR